MEIELGKGDIAVSDFFDENGEWAGIAFSEFKCDVGEVVDTGAVSVRDLKPLATIFSRNPKSLDMIIDACQRAKSKINPYPNEPA